MTPIEFELERQTSPVDVIEHVAALEDWAFERSGEDEITVSTAGNWSDYHVSFAWMSDVEALHLSCAFDLKVPAARQAEVMRLVALANEQMWVGHFDLWLKDGAVVFRHALLLTGGADPSTRQVGAMLLAAIGACDRYYQAFQFVVWAGRSATEALDAVLFETAGRA